MKTDRKHDFMNKWTKYGLPLNVWSKNFNLLFYLLRKYTNDPSFLSPKGMRKRQKKEKEEEKKNKQKAPDWTLKLRSLYGLVPNERNETSSYFFKEQRKKSIKESFCALSNVWLVTFSNPKFNKYLLSDYLIAGILRDLRKLS